MPRKSTLRAAILAIGFSFFAQYTYSEPNIVESSRVESNNAQINTPEDNKAAPDVRFSVIVTAQSGGAQEAMVVASGSWLTSRKLTHNAILIEHPSGNLMWDSGIGTEVDAQMEVFAFWEKQLFKIENVNPAINQMNEQKYPLSSIQAIIPSHMHWDHVSAIEDFPEIPVLIQTEEYQAALAGQPPGFVQSQFDSPTIKWQDLELTQQAYEGFTRSLDIYGDGRLVLVGLPGHSPGHLGLFVNTQSKGRYFFIGDATWTLKGVTDNIGRPKFVQWATGVDQDVEQNQAAVNRIYALSKKHPDLIIVPAHDELVTAKLPIFPNFL